MPGIVGLITRMPSLRAEQELRRMISAIQHESFYESGTWVDEPLGIYVGWVARRGCFAEGMPLFDESRRRVLVFSGEEYPQPNSIQRLKERGHDLGGQPASYLVHITEEDPSFPAGLNGRFHGLFANKITGTATLFNDRYGMHRLYYYQSEEIFYFAAEAKAILAVCPQLRSLDLQSLGELVGCGCVLENRSLFRGLQVLPPASAWTFQNGSIASRSSYFQPSEWEGQSELGSERYYEELRNAFVGNLPRYFNGQERIGVSLTGGLDTRMIMAWHRTQRNSLPCYTFGGMYHDCRDVVLSRRVADECNQTHQVIPIGDDYLARFPQYAERAVYLTDGCVYVNRSADLYANERARLVAPARMTGNYGSEVLRWSPAFKPIYPAQGLFAPDFMSYIGQATNTYRAVVQGHPVSFAVFKQAPWHHYGLLALEQTQLAVRTPYLDNDLVRTVFRAPKAVIAKKDMANSDICLRLIGEGNSKLQEIPTDRGLGGTRTGVYAHVVRQYLEFTFKAEYAYDYGMPQWAAQVDHLLSPLHLERLFLGRHKFCHFRIWYRDQLADYIQAMLLDSRALARPYLERKQVEQLIRSHLKGMRNYTTEIHTLLTLELVHRLFID